MSYCRKGDPDSDVYVIATYDPGVGHRYGDMLLCFCKDEPVRCNGPRKYRSMIEHLEQHQEAGDRVPMHALDRLRKESTNAPD